MTIKQKKADVNLDRRKLIKSGIVVGGAALVFTQRKSSAFAQQVPEYDEPMDGFMSNADFVSPRTKAFAQPLPLVEDAQPVAEFPANEQAAPYNPVVLPPSVPRFQRYNEFAPQKKYSINTTAFEHAFVPDRNELPTSTMWGYTGTFPSKTFKARYGEPIVVRHHNQLPNPSDFGIPHISPHLHNLHTPSDSDGFATDYITSGIYKDYHYPNQYAGIDQYGQVAGYKAKGDPREALGTLWYHDHRKDFTAQNTYKGCAGFYLLFDELDTGDETTGLKLPSGKYDVPLVFHDRVFDSNGKQYFDMFNLDGILGDKFLVNGAIQPYFEVEPRQYRFRFLIPGPSRFYHFFLSNGMPFIQIANDGNLLPNPISRQGIAMAVAERADVILDFSGKGGQTIYLENRLPQDDGRGPDDNLVNPGKKLLKFIVKSNVTVANPPTITPTKKLRDLPPIPKDTSKLKQRTWRFERGNGAWQINDKFFEEDRIDASIKKGTGEIWTLQNNSGGWDHPIHIHFEEFRILSRNGKPVPAHERGRKDVVWLGRNQEIKIFIQFRDFVGRHMMHCHNTIHEDHAMMVRWDIVP